MNGVDIILLITLIVGLMIGLSKGVVRIVIGLIALVTAFVLAASLHGSLAARFSAGEAGAGARLVAYGLIFFGVLVLGSLIAWLLRSLLKAAMLGWADRLVGGLVGLLASTLLGAFIVLPLLAYVPESKRWFEQSKLAPYVLTVADVARRGFPGELADRYKIELRNLRDRVKEKWLTDPGASSDEA